MKLLGKISLLISALVLCVSVSIGVIVIVALTRSETETATTSLQDVADTGNLVLDTDIHGQLAVFQELANSPLIQTAGWETLRTSLAESAQRLGYLDFAVVDTDGIARYAASGETADLHDRDYIAEALKGNQAISDVIISRVTNSPVVMYAVPAAAGGRETGRAALIGRRDGGFLSTICSRVKVGASGFSFMVNSSGTIIAHPDNKLVLERFNPKDAAAEDPAFAPLADAVSLALKEGKGVAGFTYQGKRLVAAYTLLPDFGWTLFTAMEYDEFMKGTYRARNIIITLVFVFLAAGILASLALALSITRPIKRIDNAARSLAELNFDITLKHNRKDELGELQSALLVIRDNMQKKVGDMSKELVEKQLNIANNLKDAIVNSSQGVTVIIKNMDAVKEKTGAQVSSVDMTSVTVEEIVRNINALDGAVETQVEHIGASGESIEQMVKDTESVASIVRSANETTVKLGNSSEESRKMLSQLTEELERIAAQSVFLEEANETLVNIAAQTNILAMNAAIEAAHAGETGKGFAVVAGEIRKLAADSDKESASISGEIKKMRIGIAAIQEASRQTVEAMTGMFTEVTTMGSSFETVNSAVEAQAANGSRVLAALATLKETTELVKNGSSDIQKRSGQIEETVERLKGISQDVNESVRNVEEATKNIERSLEVAKKIADGKYLMTPS
jgi:methyl-accepting chemotaxis protein